MVLYYDLGKSFLTVTPAGTIIDPEYLCQKFWKWMQASLVIFIIVLPQNAARFNFMVRGFHFRFWYHTEMCHCYDIFIFIFWVHN